jgi:hypothetical protein
MRNWVSCILLCLICSRLEVGVQVTGTHLHKIDEAPVGIGGRIFLDLTKGTAIDGEVTRYPGKDDLYPDKTGALLGIKSGLRLSRFGVFGKGRAGLWHFERDRSYFATDLGGVLEYYPSPRTAIRIDIGDTILFYGGQALGTVHNFQPGLGFSYRF